MPQAAVLVIDAQSGPFESAPPMYRGAETLANINALTGQARQLGFPVIFIRHTGPDGSIMARDSAPWQLHPALDVLPSDHVVDKFHADAFHDTTLHARLEELGITAVWLCGYATELCVDTTARRALTLGYTVTLVAGAHTTKDRPTLGASQIIAHHQWLLQHLASPGQPVRIRSLSELVQDVTEAA
ncbi:cysteine hydrolase family protein [Chitinibacteraceae bacterium HSL-7]